MKANRKNKLSDDSAEVSTQMVGGIVGLLLVIMVGVMVYFSFTESIDSFDEVTEIFTGYSHGDNASAQSVTVENSPASAAKTNVTCYSATAGTLSYPTFGVNNRIITIAAGSASNYTQINVTYTSGMAEDEGSTSDMAGTIFTLLPIIALVIVASIILGVVLTFGGKKGGL